MRFRPAACAAAAVLILLPGGGGAQPQGELRVAIPWTPENLDPTMNLSSIRAMVGVSMFDSLVGRDVGLPAPAGGHLRESRPAELDPANGSVDAAARGSAPVRPRQ